RKPNEEALVLFAYSGRVAGRARRGVRRDAGDSSGAVLERPGAHGVGPVHRRLRRR
ncbi:unnamed protein product, partial [Amoebophrya sp. A120]